MTNAKNWKIIKQKKIWGVSKRNKGLIGGVSVGDILIFYVKPKRIGGLFKVTSDSFQSDEKIFGPESFREKETYPYRIRLEPFIVPETFVNFEELVPSLTFIISKVFWAGYIRHAMRTIPKEDYEKIETLLKRI